MTKANPSPSAARRTVALVYARKSIVRTKQDTVSPERQIDLCKAEAERSGLAVEVYVDAEGHRSGRSEKHRPEWRKLKAQLGRPDVAAVIVADVSRASRSVKDGLTFLDECQRRGIDFVDLRYRIDTRTATGRMMAGMLLSLLQWEADVASERAKEAIAYKREDTHRHVGNAPFGTKRDAQGILVENEDWPACRALLEAYASGKFTFYKLAAHLNSQGHRFRDRKHAPVPFDRWAVRSVVSNVLIYAGYIVRGHGKAMQLPPTLDDAGNVVEQLARHVDAIKGRHAPLIGPDIAQAVIRTRMRMHGARVFRAKRTYILVPVLHCANCGQALRGSVVQGVPRYIHTGKVCRRRAGLLDAVELERRAVERLGMLRLPPARIADLRRRIEDRMAAHPETAEIRAQIAALQQTRERIKELYIAGDIDRTRYDERKRDAEATIAELSGQLGGAGWSLDAAFANLGTLADILEHGTPQQQRRALMDLHDRIEVDLSGKLSRIVFKPWVRAVFGDCARDAIGETIKAIC